MTNAFCERVRVRKPPFSLLLAFASGLCCLTACREDPLIEAGNLPPLANAGESRQVPYQGGMATLVTLDGSGSTDPDGRITAWRWWSGTARADGDAGVALPAGESADWPADVEKPEVMLPEGVWTFSLWVIDDAGAVSKPAVVKITVGDPDPLADPQVAACANAVLPRVPAACKACICKIDDDCRMNVVESMCNEKCWALIDCTATKCPEFTQNMDLGCLVENCLEFLGAGVSAMTTGGCVIPCANVCNPPG
jgi:hypothetical protein